MQIKSKLFPLFLVLVTLGTAQTQSHRNASPAEVVNQFYKFHFAHDMAFTGETLKTHRQWLTPDAIAASKKYFAAPENPNEPPYIEGDPFTGSQEYPNEFSVGTETIAATSAKVPVTFTWKEDGHSTKATLILKNIQGKWLIDDVTYPDQDSFRKLLTDALQPAN